MEPKVDSRCMPFRFIDLQFYMLATNCHAYTLPSFKEADIISCLLDEGTDISMYVNFELNHMCS